MVKVTVTVTVKLPSCARQRDPRTVLTAGSEECRDGQRGILGSLLRWEVGARKKDMGEKTGERMRMVVFG